MSNLTTDERELWRMETDRANAAEARAKNAEATIVANQAVRRHLEARISMLHALLARWGEEAHDAAHCHEGDDYHLGYAAAVRVCLRDVLEVLNRNVITGERSGGAR